MRRTRLTISAAAVIALTAVLSACSGGSGAHTSSPSAAGSPTATTTPTPAADPAAAYVDARLHNMTLRQKVASLFILHAPGTDPAALRGYVDRYGLGGLIFMGDNVPATPAALAAETAATRASDPSLPALIGIDEEGGDVTRLPWDDQPGADTLRSQPAGAARDAFAKRAELLKQVGVSVNFGTVADVTADPDSFIYDRVLGTDPSAAATRVAATVEGERGTVFSTLKHFPGHGETEADSHLTVPTTAIGRDRWAAQDEPPFQAGVKAGAEFVMFGHLVYSGVDAQPASLSSVWHRILADDLGFHGVSITDDLRMLRDTGLPQYQDPAANAVAAFAAGNTMVLMVQAPDTDPGALVDAVAAAVQQGRIPAAQIDADARKVLALRHSLAPKE